jgi:hypothetical protein
MTLVCVCAFMGCGQVCWPQTSDEAAARTRILALEHAWNQAEEVNDVKALDSIFDNAMVYVEDDGTLMTKAEFLARAKTAHLQKVVTQSMSVVLFGDTAVATGIYEAHFFNGGKLKLVRGRFMDTWVFKNSTWICIAAQSTPIQR